jgi:uncharacterized protein
MQKQKIPVTLDVRKAAVHSTRYEGYVVLAQLKRLTELCVSDKGDVDVVLETGVDPQGLSFLKGQAKTTVEVICQRCNENMSIDLTADFAYSPVSADFVEDEDNPFPEHYEPLVVNEFGEVRLAEIIEDELILDIPLIPKHDEADCSASDMQMSWGEIEEEVEEEKPNPFAVLNQLKRN